MPMPRRIQTHLSAAIRMRLPLPLFCAMRAVAGEMRYALYASAGAAH